MRRELPIGSRSERLESQSMSADLLLRNLTLRDFKRQLFVSTGLQTFDQTGEKGRECSIDDRAHFPNVVASTDIRSSCRMNCYRDPWIDQSFRNWWVSHNLQLILLHPGSVVGNHESWGCHVVGSGSQSSDPTERWKRLGSKLIGVPIMGPWLSCRMGKIRSRRRPCGNLHAISHTRFNHQTRHACRLPSNPQACD